MSLSLWRACPAVWESKKWKEKQSDGNIWMSFVLQCQTMGVEWIFSRRWRCTYLCKYIKCRNMTSAMSAAGSCFFFSSVDLKQWLGLSPIEMSVNYMYRHDKLAVLWLHLFYYNVVYKVLSPIFLSDKFRVVYTYEFTDWPTEPITDFETELSANYQHRYCDACCGWVENKRWPTDAVKL